ncbi:hypothetical protein CEXT_162101 [Caerostris extrusa]|uniref:Uncharacterized protein n=1 Tax=Caerostris extrusa TaxID=172846 RepID=A0AAV4MIF7_CAEEX|nr:hypothetical protein CEXT_162101 [Caerostris extrusa]
MFEWIRLTKNWWWIWSDIGIWSCAWPMQSTLYRELPGQSTLQLETQSASMSILLPKSTCGIFEFRNIYFFLEISHISQYTTRKVSKFIPKHPCFRIVGLTKNLISKVCIRVENIVYI